jgi:hypothetical protein
MKLRRFRIESAVSPHVDGWYAMNRAVHWA